VPQVAPFENNFI